MDKRHVIGYIGTGVVGIAVGAIVGASASTDAAPKPSPTVTNMVAAPAPSASESSAPIPSGDWSPQEWSRHFQAYTVKHGTAQQKSAVNHVTKIKGFDGKAEDWEAQDVKIFTDYRGEEYDHSSEAELIIDALTDWQVSEEGDVYVSVYNANGDDEGSGNL